MGGGVLSKLTRTTQIPTSLLFRNRSRKSFSSCPSIVQPVPDCRRPDSCFTSPLSERLNTSIKAQSSISSRIVTLDDGLSPNTILRRIAPVIIHTLQRMLSGGTQAHVKEEVREAVPSCTNLYSTTAVVFVRRAQRIVTSIFHMLPSMIFRRTHHPVSRGITANNLTMVTAARDTYVVDERTAVNGSLSSAFAFTKPVVAAMTRVVTDVVGESYYLPASEYAAG